MVLGRTMSAHAASLLQSVPLPTHTHQPTVSFHSSSSVQLYQSRTYSPDLPPPHRCWSRSPPTASADPRLPALHSAPPPPPPPPAPGQHHAPQGWPHPRTRPQLQGPAAPGCLGPVGQARRGWGSTYGGATDTAVCQGKEGSGAGRQTLVRLLAVQLVVIGTGDHAGSSSVCSTFSAPHPPPPTW